MSISRRNFIKYTSAAAIGTAAFGCHHGKNVNVNTKSGIIMPKKGKRVVVLGGGWGGNIAAKYIKLEDPSIDVVLVEKEDNFISCPVSNWVIGGFKTMADITRPYDNLSKNYGIKVLKATATGLDPVSKKLITDKGEVEYDKLLVSPGISYAYDSIEGLNNPTAIDMFPAAFKAGPETVKLRDRIQAMKPGGVVLVSVPEKPYRCPPGPYERICLIADYLKKNKPGSKVVVFDSNFDIASKAKLFHAAWKDYYSDIIEYVPDNYVTKVDVGSGRVISEQGDIKPDVANIIPKMQAGKVCFDMDLMSKPDDKWVRAEPYTFESYKFKDVHVVGDATHNGAVGGVPKSGYVANSMGKVAASAIVRLLNGKEPAEPTFVNTCYSLVSEEEAIFVSAVYEYNKDMKRIKKITGGLSPERGKLFGKHAEDWATSIWQDMLG